MARIGQLITAASMKLVVMTVLLAGLYTGGGGGIRTANAAQFCAFPNGSWQLCDEGRAFAECSAGLARARAEVARIGGTASIVEACILQKNVNVNQFRCSYRGYSAGANGPCPGHESIVSGYPPANTCDKRPDWNGPYTFLSGGKPKNGSVTCNDGCKQAWYSTGDGYFNGKYTSVPGTCNDYDDRKCKAEFGTGYYWNQGMGSCEPEEAKCKDGSKVNSLGKCEPEPCPDGMVQNPDGTCKKKENECPAGQVRSPDGRCLPGDGQCAKGEVRGPDGTCKKDSDDDGQPDEPGEKDTFSGGDDCSMPPSCSGSPILCGQARIQWRIDCNTRKNRNIAGGSCAAVPVCRGEKGDAMEYAGLLMQWRTACAAEKLASQGNNNGGDGAQPEWTKVGGMSTDPGLGASPDDTKVLTVKRLGVEHLDQSGFGGGGSCIGFAISGGSGIGSGFLAAEASPPDFFCNYIILIRAVIILSATVTCAFILTSGGKN